MGTPINYPDNPVGTSDKPAEFMRKVMQNVSPSPKKMGTRTWGKDLRILFRVMSNKFELQILIWAHGPRLLLAFPPLLHIRICLFWYLAMAAMELG